MEPNFLSVSSAKGNGSSLFVDRISIALEPKFANMIHSVGLTEIVKPSTGELEFSLLGKTIKMKDLL